MGGSFLSAAKPRNRSRMIALESVSKRYGSKTIIHDLSFTVGKGEIVGFLGPNGAGKTTTMRMIAGYTTATSGRVTVAGFDMATQNEQAARKHRLPAGASAALRRAGRFDLSALRRQGQRRAAPRDSGATWTASSALAVWRAWSAARSTSCRKAIGSASAWRRRCSANPKCCCSTSRPPDWIRGRFRKRARSSALSARTTRCC